MVTSSGQYTIKLDYCIAVQQRADVLGRHISHLYWVSHEFSMGVLYYYNYYQMFPLVKIPSFRTMFVYEYCICMYAIYRIIHVLTYTVLR